MREVSLRKVQPTDSGWIVSTHGRLYRRDEGFDDTFEPLVADVVERFVAPHDRDRERGWVAEADGQLIGTIFCCQHTEEIAQMRLFLVLPEWRGQGVGWRLLNQCMDFARAAGYARLRLWTFAEHEAACALYTRTGFTCLKERPVEAFGRALTEQTWDIPLVRPPEQ